MGRKALKKSVVFGKEITIRSQKNLASHQGFMGFYDPNSAEIVIDADLSDLDYKKTLIHEIGHVLFDRLGWRQSVPIQVEEIIVESYSQIMTELFSVKMKK